MDLLKPTSDRKTQAYPGQRNTYGLMRGPIAEGGTCPGCTIGPGGCCERPGGRKTTTCYVDKLTRAYPGVKASLCYNRDLLNESGHEGKVLLLLKEFLRFSKECLDNKAELNYRIHWSGDVFDLRYAKALREAITDCHFINFWAYTRFFDCVPLLAGIPNLQLYLSLDKVNFETGYPVYLKYMKANVHYCYMGDEKPDDDVLTPCPVDIDKLPLEGACHKCRLCLTGHNVWFKTR